MRLINYDASDGDAGAIFINRVYRDGLAIVAKDGQDATTELINAGVLSWLTLPFHGYVENADAAAAFAVTEAFFAMSASFNNSETPVFFARVVKSETGATVTQEDVATISFTLYRYNVASIRSGASGFEAVEGFDGITLNVADVVVDAPQEDARCGFAPNVIWEPPTRENNPFKTAGNYRGAFTITPAAGNTIPVVIDFKVAQ